MENILNVLQAKGRLELRDQSESAILSNQDIIDNVRKLLRSQNAGWRPVLPYRLEIFPVVIYRLGHARRRDCP